MYGCKVICVRCINCSYNNIAKGICIHDKIAIFVYTGKISYKYELLKAAFPYPKCSENYFSVVTLSSMITEYTGDDLRSFFQYSICYGTLKFTYAAITAIFLIGFVFRSFPTVSEHQQVEL